VCWRSAQPMPLRRKKSGVCEVGLDRLDEQCGVGGRARLELADHGRAAQPAVRIGDPRADHGPQLVRVCSQQRADPATRDLVGEVPPAARHDPVPQQRHPRRVEPRQVPAVAGERQGQVALLTELRAVPEFPHDGVQRCTVGEGMCSDGGLEQPLVHRPRNPAERHRRLHQKVPENPLASAMGDKTVPETLRGFSTWRLTTSGVAPPTVATK
jgi:hypothetical protein